MISAPPRHPFISIIIPSYNCEKHIRKCVFSIIDQRFADYEIIIQDGLSSDGTLEIIKDLQTQYPAVDIKIFSEKDLGIYDAMNKGIKSATGNWVYFLGSDDYLINADVLQSAVDVMKSKNIEILYGNVIWGDTGLIYDGPFTIEKLFEKNICHQCIFYAKQVFEKYGFFDLQFPLLADWDLNCRLFQSKARILYVDMVMAYFNLGLGLSADNSRDPFYEKKKKMQDDYDKSFRFKFNFHKRRILNYFRSSKK